MAKQQPQPEQEPEPVESAPEPTRRRRRAEPASSGDPLTDFLGSRQGKTLQREVVRGMFGLLRKRL
jgi:hypothetical protein